MKKISKRFIRLSVTTFLVVAVQLGIALPAMANDAIVPAGTSGDLSISLSPAGQERAFAALVCNNGTDDVIGFVLDAQFTNYGAIQAVTLPPPFVGSNPTNQGTYDGNTGIWNGQIRAAECVAIGFIGIVAGDVGEIIEVTVTIESSTLGDSTANVDPTPGNDVASYSTAPITLDGDIALSTRLLTTSEIGNGDTVEYELTITNQGGGAYLEGSVMPLGIYFIIPEGTTFVGVTDVDTGDSYTTVPGTCGVMNPSFLPPAFTGLTAQLVGCQLDSATGTIPAGDSFKLIYSMTANGPFATGSTQVLAIAVADDADSLLLQIYMFTPGGDPFAFQSNNTNVLAFDGSELTVTVNRCAGVGAVVTVNDACFTITFNKEIYEPDFTVDDVLLTGGGNVYNFSKTGVNEWTVRINGMTLGGTVALSLDAAGVQDLSAVQNGTEVLGINTVRFEAAESQGANQAGGVAAGTASGTLPATGADALVWQLAIMLMLLGSGLVLTSRRVLIKYSN